MKQNLQNLQNFAEAAPQPCRRWEATGWRASHNDKKILRVLKVL
jgi:hypothetical protein